MSDLIDRQALMESVGVADDCEKCQYNDTIHKGFCTMPSEFVNVCEAIADAPSAEPKKGRWKRNDNGTYSCNRCQSWIPEEQHYYARYCIYCGAKMEKEVE